MNWVNCSHLAGHTVLTGGYMGSMEAVSRGANEAGGHVIGVTCADIEAWRGSRANAWVKEERRFATLQERLNELILACDAAIALPGGPGTLAEVCPDLEPDDRGFDPAQAVDPGRGWLEKCPGYVSAGICAVYVS